MIRKPLLIVVSAVVMAWSPLPLPGQAPVTPAEDPSGSLSSATPGLPLNLARRIELEDALRDRNYKRAETILIEEAERDPKSGRTAKLLAFAGGVFFLDGQYVSAAIAWKKSEAIAPLDDRSRFTLAMAYIKVNRRDWARSELEKLEAAQPQNPLYLYWLARLDYDAQKYKEAVVGLNRVLELEPKMMRAYDTLGLCYDYLGQFDEAIKNYNRAVELNRLQSKPSPWPHLDLAVSLVAVNQLTEAEKNLREALRYDPRLPQAHYQLGRVLEKQGTFQAAVQALNEAVTLDPSYPEPHFLLGRIYQRLGDSQLAKAEIEQFQQLDKAREAPPSSQPSSIPNVR